jgi:subtilisin family serine protease
VNREQSSIHLLALVAVAVLTLESCSDLGVSLQPAMGGMIAANETSTGQAARHIVVFAAERVPADFPQRVAALGGSVDMSLDSIGVTAVIGLTDTAAAQLATAPYVKAVELDPLIGISGEQVELADTTGDLASSAALASTETSTLPTSAPFYPRQWNMRAIFAHQAWAAGQTGSRDVVVAVLDAGIDYLHPDLVGLVDLVRSKSFVPEEDVEVAARFPGRLAISDLNYHGTAIASIIASNGRVVAGVNQHVTLLAVKIWNRSLVGPASRFLAGLVYAADQGADVINVSGEYRRDKSDSGGVAAAFNRATNYAFRKGALLVSVAGNDTRDLDHDGDRVRFPCQSPHAMCASGTGPAGADGINGPWHDVDARAPYSAAPHVAGLAALLVAHLGHGNPALIRARILQLADDLGEPGTDPYYGKGRINVPRALGLINESGTKESP